MIRSFEASQLLAWTLSDYLLKFGLNQGRCYVRSYFAFMKLFLFLIFRKENKVVCDKILIEFFTELGLFVTNFVVRNN